MNRKDARTLSEYHKFTVEELYAILVEAYNSMPDSFWEKRCKVNGMMDNGYHFNQLVEWVGFEKDNPNFNKTHVPSNMVAYRVLEMFGKFSKVQLPSKNKKELPEIKATAKPKL